VGVNETEVQLLIRGFIVENFLFGDESAAPRPDQSLVQSGLVDSTGVLELAAFLESKFGVKTDDDDLIAENFDTIGSIARFVLRPRP